MNNPADILINEHDLIELVANYAIILQELDNKEPIPYIALVKKLLNFFTDYADRYHHQKEELLLFPKMCEKNDLLKDGIIKEMIENHDDFRKSIKDIEYGISIGDMPIIQKTLKKYCVELLNHISVENEELFQMIEMILSESEIERMYYSCIDIDIELGLSRKEELESYAKSFLK